MYGIAHFLAARANRVDMDVIAQPGLIDHILKNRFSHWRTADVASADEQYVDHAIPQYLRETKIRIPTTVDYGLT
jgi:hypothetical protein